jgi:hypothetical protein
MATSPNFNWPEPDNTDLVKNGALAIRTAVDAIDTSLVDLKGGTTGQVLSKTSATDMDFTWTTPSTAAGYAVNGVLNSGFDIWQRGTASTAIGSGTFLADRWQAARTGFAAGASQSRQATGDTTNLPFIQYCARIQRDSGNTSTAGIFFGQNMETVNSIPFAGKQVVISFYARKGANYSPTSSILVSNLASGTGTDQNLITSGTLTGFDNTTQNNTLTTTWQRFTMTKTVAATATQLAWSFVATPTGTAGAADYFEITGVQLEVGTTATAFTRNAATIQGELAACQRYYWRNTPSGGYGIVSTGGGVHSTTQADVYVTNPVQMRVIPTSMDFSTLELNIPGTSNTTVTGLTFTSNECSPLVMKLAATVASGLTASRTCNLRQGGSSAAYLGFSAEL